MKQLWSPWRMAYIEERNSEPGCLFCNLWNAAPGPASWCSTKRRRRRLNRFPYTNGHVMVAPQRTRRPLDDLDPAASAI
jgi:ATP adenylyltransferase